MQKIIIFISLLVLTISCSKNSTKNYDSENDADIQEYLKTNNLQAKRTASGLYYIINKQGNRLQPNIKKEGLDEIIISYKESFLNGDNFDGTDVYGKVFDLKKSIEGISEGVSLFNEGGEGKLIIPSKLAFGSRNYNIIPAGSVLVYDFNLISTKEGLDSINKYQIKDYLDNNNLIATDSTAGIYSVIEKVGFGIKPSITSTIRLNLKGYFLKDDIFIDTKDEAVEFEMRNAIRGLQIGLSRFKEGGKGKILIPSKYGYGFKGKNDSTYYPPGVVLVYDIELNSVLKK